MVSIIILILFISLVVRRKTTIFERVVVTTNMGTRKSYLRDGRAPIPLNEVTSRVMSANKAKDTKPEILLRKALWKKGVRGYRLHWKAVPGRPDLVFSKYQTAVFVHGCFWHRCPHCYLPMPKSNVAFWTAKFEKNTERDQRKQQAILQLGWKVIVIWECEIKRDCDATVIKLMSYININ